MDTYRSAVPPGTDKKAEAGAGSATEFHLKEDFVVDVTSVKLAIIVVLHKL